MEIESESVTKLIFPEGVPDQWKENPDFYSYLSKLGSYSVEHLGKEPDRLADEKSVILHQTQQLAFANYKTFIQTAECSREIFKQFNKTEESLESLVDGLPKLSASCEEFAEASSEIKTHRRLNSLTLTRNAQLLQVLEIPQLMDSCIRDGYFEEALQLASYVRRLGNKHSDIPIIVNIVKEVEVARWSLMHRLIAQLRTDLMLPRCLQVVGYLRRMEVFAEAELRLKFLQARDAWFQGLISAIPTEDANQHLMKTLELSRINLFIIMTQYRAVFSDDEPILSSNKQHSVSESTIFHSWVIEKINQFIAVLEQDLKRGVGFSLSSLLGQCMYFGLSFSRIGADFRALIAPIFVKTIVSNFAAAIRKATKKFDADMERFTLPKTNLSSQILQNREHRQQANNKEHEQAPDSLLEFYPLADYCNSVLTALNDLRLCAPLAAAFDITQSLRDSLSSITNAILVFYRQEQQALSPSEKEAFTRFCVCFGEHLLPYLQRCVHAIYKPSDIAKYLGVTTFKLQEQKLTYLDEVELVGPISHLLPVKMTNLPPGVLMMTSASQAPEQYKPQQQTVSETPKESSDQSIN